MSRLLSVDWGEWQLQCVCVCVCVCVCEHSMSLHSMVKFMQYMNSAQYDLRGMFLIQKWMKIVSTLSSTFG